MRVLDTLFPLPRTFAMRLWDGTQVPASGTPTFTLVLNHPGALRRLLTPPIELSLGEAFIYGDIDIEGDIFAFFPVLHDIYEHGMPLWTIASLVQPILALPSSTSDRPSGRGSARLHGAVHSPARDRTAVQYHYDVGADFFALWLGKHMQYTCAYFSSADEDLDSAQERKLAYICRKLRLRPGERLLDMGCGYGGLAMYAARTYGVQVLGVTLSSTQVTYANEQIVRAGLADRVTVALRDYREVRGEGFDKIVSVGMFEHVGRSHLPEYFTRAYQLLKAGQVFLNHGISRRAARTWLPGEPGRNGAPPKRASRTSWQAHLGNWILAPKSFTQHYVFPDGELAPVSEVNTVAERSGFEVRDVENLREHYGLTLRRWVAGLEEHWDEAVRVAGEVTCRTWRLYLAAAAFGFESGELNINQSLLVKPLGGKSNLPLTREYMRVDAGE